MRSPQTPLLDRVDLPADLRQIAEEDLPRLADELRAELVDVVSRTGGHLGAGLGVVELTIALHYVFDTPYDRLIWDVGHQAYPHKILTGRRDRMPTIRRPGGLSGFTKRSESEYDPFGAGHSSTSISAGLGMAVARDLDRRPGDVVAVIGDGSMSAGLAYEAMNNAGSMDARLIVILNDNDMSIAPPVGALSNHLARLISGRSRLAPPDPARAPVGLRPKRIDRSVARSIEQAQRFLTGGTLFEHMGFDYVGPIDGHDLAALLPALRSVKAAGSGPVLIHVVTRKGHGYAPAEVAADRLHGVVGFDVATGAQVKARQPNPAYTRVFADALIEAAHRDDRIVAITAAMPTGTGLDRFAAAFPGRCFDVGIAEQHAVTFAAGLAAEGYRPFCAIYSSFLQRAYDQVVHDVALQHLPVRFALDRAGFVGADGPTHAGAYDLAFLSCLPGMVVMAPADEAELARMVATAAAYDEGPIAVRFPRGEGTGAVLPAADETLSIGRGRILREGGGVAILSLGTRLADALAAADQLAALGLPATVADARFAKPLDRDLVERLARDHPVLVTVEEGACNGFGASVLQHLAGRGLLDRGLAIRTLTLPDLVVDHDNPAAVHARYGLDAAGIARAALDALGRHTLAPALRA